jgi:hypothetical protein
VAYLPEDSPFVEHTVYAGLSWNVTKDFALSITYQHAFEDAIAGPLFTPAGAVPGTSVRNTCSGDSLQTGATVKFGGTWDAAVQ